MYIMVIDFTLHVKGHHWCLMATFISFHDWNIYTKRIGIYNTKEDWNIYTRKGLEYIQKKGLEYIHKEGL